MKNLTKRIKKKDETKWLARNLWEHERRRSNLKQRNAAIRRHERLHVYIGINGFSFYLWRMPSKLLAGFLVTTHACPLISRLISL